MKRLFIIGGTMGVGKTTVCRELQDRLPRSVFLDGDWCWDAKPENVTDETKAMVLQNVKFLLNQYLSCPAYDNVVFCWVLHEQHIIDSVLSGVDTANCDVKVVSLVCSPDNLRRRLEKDIQNGLRTSDVISRSIERLPLYDKLNTLKISTDGKTAADVATAILAL